MYLALLLLITKFLIVASHCFINRWICYIIACLYILFIMMTILAA